MSLAKKSVKWLVALFVIFALILTASVALGNVARANAEPLETAEDTTAPSTVIVEVTDSVGNVYPNLANVVNVTRTLTVNYYVEIPGDAGAYSYLKLSPVLVYADNTHVAKPNSIVINSALATYADLEYVAEYLNGTANAFSVSMKTGATISDLNGVDSNGAAISNKYLVTATYVLSYEEEEDVVGAYELTFADDPEDEDDGSAIAPADEGVTYIPTIENGEFTISEIVEYPVVDPTSFVYDGDEKTVYSAVSNAYTYTGATGTVVDDYTITFSLNDFYIWHDTTAAGGYTRAPYAVPWEITKKPIAIPKAVSGLIFNGSEQEGVVNDDNSSLYDELGWGMDDFNLASGSAKGTAAGNYTATFALEDTYNTEWANAEAGEEITNKTIAWSIAKRSITVPVSAGTIYTYNGQAQSFDFSADPLIDADYITITGTPQTNVGEYTVTAALTYPANTYWAADTTDTADKEYAFVINPALITVPTPANVTYTFNKTAQSFQWADTPDALITITGTPQTDAGEYTITASIPANYAWNDEGHTTADKTFPFVIAKKSVTVPSLDASHFTYNGQEKSVALVQAVADEGYIAERSGTTWRATNAGEYAVKVGLVYPDDTYWGDDTTDTADKTLNWDISKVQISIAYNKETYSTTYGNPIDTPTTVVTGDVASGDNLNISITGIPAAGSNAGVYPLHITYTANANYDVTAAEDKNYTITKALVEAAVTKVLSQNTFTYTGEEITCEFLTTGFSSQFTITGHKQTDVGVYDVTETLLDPVNYMWSHKTYDDPNASAPYIQYSTFEITKKAVAIPTAISGLEYNGEAQVGVIKTDSSYYDLYSGYDERTAPGNYSATYRLKSTTNSYWAGDGTDVADKTVEWSIAKKSITKPEISVDYKTYNGTSQSYSGSGTGYTFTGSGTNAGSYPVTVTLSDKDNTMWNDGTSEDYDAADKLVINKKSVTLSITKSASSSFYHDAVATITVNATGIVNEGDLGTISYQAKYSTGSGYAYYTKEEFESTDPYPIAKNYILEPTYTANDNYTVDASSSPYEIKKVTVTAPVLESETTTFGYDGSTHGISFTEASLVDAALITFTGTQSATSVGEYTYTASLPDTDNYLWSDSTTAAKSFLWSITVKSITKPTPYDGAQYVYDSYNKQFMLDVVSAETGYYTVSNNIRRNAGTQTVTVSLKDKTNTQWADGTTADLEFTFTVQRRPVNLSVSADAASHVYGNTPANVSISATGVIDAFSCSYKVVCVDGEAPYAEYNPTQFNAGLNVGHYTLNPIYNDINGNYDVTVSEPFAYEITTRQIQIPVLNQDDPSFVYNGSAQGISFFSGSLDDADYFTLSGTNSATNVGNYTYTATLNDATNCEWADSTTAAKNYDWSITTRYITVPTVEDDTFAYDGNEHSIGFSNVDNDYVDITYDTQSAIGVYTDTTTVALKAAHAGNIAWDDAGHTTAAKNYTLTIEVSEITFTVIPVYNDVAKSGTEVTVNVFAALPAATNYRWFKFTGYTFDNAAATTATLAMSGGTLYANYTYAVGAGDVDGDGVISSLDVIQLKRWNVGLDRAKKIADAATAWTKTDDSSVTSAVLYTALDANSSGKFNSSDIVATREALATGYNFKIIVSEGIIQVAKVTRVNVSNYGDLIANIEMGNAVTLTTDITAATTEFDEDLDIPVDIDLGNHKLTVLDFKLNTNTAGATLKVTNGTLYTVTGITVTAPNGNVVVASVNGYSYDGTVVNLAAYSESLHIEDDVAFYIYKAQVSENVDYDNVNHFKSALTEAAEPAQMINALSEIRIEETAARMADIAAIKADTEKTPAQKAEDINALDVKKAILEVPIDTHVVVEAAAKLSADKIVVKAQSDTSAPAVTTFAIEVKNAEAEVVTVDVSEIKDDTGAEVVYVVDEVAISGNTSKVEVVAGENTAAEVKKYVAQIGTTNYESLQAAINAAQNFDTIKLLASVTDGTGLKTADDNAQKTKVGKTFTIDFGGFTYTVNGASVGSTGTETQAMHWGEKDNITLKNGTFVVSENAATVAGSNGKIVKMAMQNYANLTVKNMTMDFSNIVVSNYGNYTGTIYEAYTGLEISLFNTNAGTINIEGSTITMPANSTKGICISIAGATITNSTINGAVSLNSEDADPSVTVTGSTITKGVVPYFAADMVAAKNGVWTIVDAIEVYNAAELTEALAAGANKIIVMDDISSTNGFLVASNAKINLNNHTVTVETGANVNNRAFKVTNGTLEIYNGEIIAQGGGTTSSNGYGCYGSFRAEVGTTLIAHDLTLRNSRPWGLNVKLLGASAELTNVDIISAYGGGIEVTDDDGADGTVQGYAKMVDCSVTQTGYFDHCSSAVSVSGNSTLDVYSTTYTAETAIYVFSSGGTINVYGGEFTGNRNAIVVASDLNSYPNAACIVNVYDSEINGTFSHSGKACDKINIYGGTFDHDPTAYVVEGYAAVEEDGVWTIVPATIVTNEAELKAAVAANAPYIVVGDDFSLASTVSLSGGKNITIDMNGHTITSNDKVLFSVYAGNSLEFTGNGTIALNNPSKTTRPAMWIEGSTNVASVRESYLTIGEGVTVTSTGYGLVLYEVTGTNYAYGVVITVDGTITTNRNAAICAIGNIAQHDGDVVIGEPIAAISEINIGSTASLTAMNSAIYAAGFAVWNIESGAHLTGADAIYAKSGYLTIGDDVILTATKDPATPYAYNGNGENPTGDGIVIDSCNYPGKAPVVNYTSALLDNITVTAEGAQKVGIYWAVANETELNEAIAAKAPYIYLRNSFAISETIVVDYETVLNMNGKTLYNEEDLWEQYPGDWSIISVREDGNLTITGDGTISAKENDCYAIDVVDGATLVIEDGTYVGNVSAVYICHGGNVTINGGDFSLLQLYPDERYMLNCLDADYTAGTANFTVKGGTFHGFNPADNASEGAHTDYLAEGYVATLNNDIWMVEAIADTEAVARIGKVAYATFDAAVAAAQDGDTIVLLADVTYGTDRVVPVWEIKAFNIDLNGKTFTTNSNQGITLSNNGYGASAICYGDYQNTSPARNIKVSNGTIRTAYGAGLYFDAAVTATLENLTVAQNYPANVQSTDEYSAAVRLTSGATVNIYSGTYSGKNAIAISNSGGYANIYGGDFRGVLFINGGASSTKVLTICGGTFDHDPTAYVDTTAYDVTEANGIYTVSAKA